MATLFGAGEGNPPWSATEHSSCTPDGGPTSALPSLALASRRVRSPNPPGPIPTFCFKKTGTPDGAPVFLERAKGIEPSLRAWEARVLPLNYARIPHNYISNRYNPQGTMAYIEPMKASNPASPIILTLGSMEGSSPTLTHSHSVVNEQRIPTFITASLASSV